MRRIGYIYKYSSIEKKGILVYGTWRGIDICGNDNPLLFHESDCVSAVESNQLVYFDLLNNKATNIVRASLANFDIDLILSLSSKEKKSIWNSDNWYYDNTHIQFENLSDVVMPDDDIIRIRASKSGKSIEDEKELYLNEKKMKKHRVIGGKPSALLPDGIEDLFNCFNKYEEHPLYNDGFNSAPYDIQPWLRTIDILNLKYWLNDDIENGKVDYFGKSREQIKLLSDIFILHKHNNGDEESTEKVWNSCISFIDACQWSCIGEFSFEQLPRYTHTSISPDWTMLLSNFEDEELRNLIKEAPHLQPALPIEFCKNNLDILTDGYCMPSLEICHLYCMFQIEHIETLKQYNYLKDKLYSYLSCMRPKLNQSMSKYNLGYSMCMMDKKDLNEMKERLDSIYNDRLSCN